MATVGRTVVRTMRLVTYQATGEHGLKIKFPFSHMTLENVKSLPGRRYHGDNKADIFWSAPATVGNIEKLLKWGFQPDDSLITYYKDKVEATTDIKPISIAGLNGVLFPYQQQGVQFINRCNGRAIIGDEMGLGKTVQALAWLQQHPEIRPAVIIVPATLKLNWLREAERWMTNPNVQVLFGTKTNTPIIGDIIVINYDIVAAWLEQLRAICPKAVIMDEVHYIKNNAAARTKAVKQVCNIAPHVIGLSGTPIVNRPVEFYNIINIIDRNFAPNRWTYLHRYCGAKNNGFGWDFSGATNTEELHERLINTMFIRRKKSDVLKELPEKSYSYIPLELNNKKEYDYAEGNFIDWMRMNKGIEAAERASAAETLSSIEALKQLAVQGKMNSIIRWISDFLESGEKLVLMAIHQAVISRIMAEFSGMAVKVDGSTPMSDRQTAVDRFQSDDTIRLFVGNIKAAGVGITLTASSNVAFIELPWTPGELMQAEDRCHRIGQKNSVMVYYLLAENTIEMKIARLLDSKRSILNRVLDGGSGEDSSLFADLLAGFK